MDMTPDKSIRKRERKNEAIPKPLTLDGCTVYMSYSTDESAEVMRKVKEILLSAYRASAMSN